jgi:hypothetical protein
MATWNVSVAAMNNPNDGTNTFPNTFQSYINNAASGDTVNLPTGTYGWNPSQTVTINKSLNIVGLGAGTPPSQGAGTIACQIQNLSAGGIMIQVTSGTDGHIRISGIYFNQVNNISGNLGNFQIQFGRSDTRPPSAGNQWTVIVTNCIFDSGGHFLYAGSVQRNGCIFSHCTFQNGSGINGLQMTGTYGTADWNQPATMGLVQDQTVYNGIGNGYSTTASSVHLNVGDTAQGYMGFAGLNCTYIEDCILAPSGSSGSMNVDDGSRVVIRFCSVTDNEIFGHGQESSGQGMRHFEFYNNQFHITAGNPFNYNAAISCRGAVFLAANNTFETVNGKPTIVMQCQQINRNAGPCPCQLTYPANRQVGIGWSSASSSTYGNPVCSVDGTGAASDPCFVWNNTGPGGAGYANYIQPNPFAPDECGHGLSVNSFIVQNRDYYVEVPRPGWQPYTYPHPLLNTAPQPPTAPTLSSIITGPTPSFVQAKSGSVVPGGSSLTITATFNNTQIAGNQNVVIVWPGGSSTTVASVTDSIGNTYTLIPGFPKLVNGWNIYAYTCTVALGGANNTVTVTQSTSTYGEMAILEYSSLLTPPFDVWSAAGDGTSTTLTGSSPVTTVNPADLIVSGFICDINFTNSMLPGAVTSPPGWNQETTASAGLPTSGGTSFVADLQTYSVGTYNPVWTQGNTNLNTGKTGNSWTIFALALKSSLTTPPAQSHINLAWTASSGATGYNLYYGTTNPVTSLNGTKVTLGNVTSYTLNASAGTYYMAVTGTNAVGESSFSNQVSGVISSGVIPLNASVLIR